MKFIERDASGWDSFLTQNILANFFYVNPRLEKQYREGTYQQMGVLIAHLAAIQIDQIDQSGLGLLYGIWSYPGFVGQVHCGFPDTLEIFIDQVQ